MSRTRMKLLLTGSMALLGCARRTAPATGSAAQDTDGDAQSIRPAASEAASTTPLPLWTEAIRRGRWEVAETAMAALGLEELRKPEVRFARARVALAVGKHAEALVYLERLEMELPLLRDAVGKARAEALLVVGPYDRAAAWYSARNDPASWVLAAEAWDKAEDVAHVRVECDRVIRANKRSRSLEEKARRLRMKVIRAREGDAASAVDARWLATKSLDEATASAAARMLEGLPQPAPLTAAELVTRARVLAEAQRSSDALHTLDRAATASGFGRTGSTSVDVCHARAEAYYKDRAHYAEAALTYRRCAQLSENSAAAEDSFLAARALSRAHKDTEASAAFAAVIRQYPKTPWATEAAFHVGRTHALAGRWNEASRILDEYVKRSPSGKTATSLREAKRYRAISHLLARDRKVARKLLEELSADEESADGSIRSRWTNLAALAALLDDDRTHAVALWSDVARRFPLSWSALVARARLASLGAPVPPSIEPDNGKASEDLKVDLPPPVDMLHRIGLDTDASDALREREASIVAGSGGRGTEALCSVYGALNRGKRRYQIAQLTPYKLLSSAPGPTNRWAWECAYPRPHGASVREHEERASLPPDLLWAIMRQESAFDEEVVSSARAVGLLQLMPATAASVATAAGIPHEESWLVRPEHNIALGALYLRDLLQKMSGNIALAAGAYNAGPEAIARWKEHSQGVELDVFVELIPFLETREYVVRVMGNLAHYGFLSRGDAGVPSLALATQ